MMYYDELKKKLLTNCWRLLLISKEHLVVGSLFVKLKDRDGEIQGRRMTFRIKIG